MSRTMKKILLLISLCFLFIIEGKAQLPYKPLSEFGTDTTAFLVYNFMDRADYYKGKTLEEVAKDIQMPVKHIVHSIIHRGGTFEGLGLYVYDEKKVFSLFDDKDIEFYDIVVYWEDEIPIKKGENIVRKYKTTKEIYEAYKDYRIKKVEVGLSQNYKDYEKYYPRKKTKSSNVETGRTKDGGMYYRYKARRKR